MTNANKNRWKKKIYVRNQSQWAFVVLGQQKYMMGFILKYKMTNKYGKMVTCKWKKNILYYLYHFGYL
jgi:ribosome-associated toxin RatA of RatAB toxin-antitoxin module